jgi:hypothetical protein
MSKIPDIRWSFQTSTEEAAMPFEEKYTWVQLVVMAIVPIAYFAVVLPQLATTPPAEIAYQVPMIIAIIASIILTIVGTIVMSIGTAVSAEIRAPGSAENLEIDRKDERDHDIGRRGELAGYYVASAGMVVVLVLTMMQFAYFWIASVLYLSFASAAIVSAAVKLVAYRRGF